MLTPGFRLYFGFAVAGFLAAVTYGVASGDGGGVDYLGFLDAEAWLGALSLGWKGGVGDHTGYVVLVMFAVASSFLGLLLVAFRDADAESAAELAGGTLPPAQRPTAGTFWPIVGALGAGVMVVGLVVHAAIFVTGLVILLAVAFEWMMSAWADRATGDPGANRELRDRIMKPIEVPVLGALGMGALVLAFSRVLLTVSKEWAVWVGVAVTAVIFVVALMFALAPKLGKAVLTAVLLLGVLGTLAGGIVAAARGERDFEQHDEEEAETAEEALGLVGVGS